MVKFPRSEKAQTPSEECMVSAWDADLEEVPDYPSRPCADCKKPLNRHTQPHRRPPQGWPKDTNTTWCPMPFQSPEYIPMISSSKMPKPVE